MLKFSAQDRKANIDQIKSKNFDLLVIGGGISGAGVARDASSRGMSVALIEADDFASGTSSRSSKLIHGGIRYLENFEFGLVFEALAERSLLFEIAPHLVHPLRFLLPIYKSSRVGPFKMGLGMFLYDALSLFKAPQLHERLSPKQTLERIPVIDSKDLKASFEYSDAYMDDDRLVIETLRSANSFGALCASYVSAVNASWDDSRLVSVICKDNLSNKEFTVSAKQVVSTVGPWTDEVAKKITRKWRPCMRPSKGIHLTFSRDRFPLSRAVVLATEADNRIIFGIPRHEMVIVGTTDTDYTGDPAEVKTNKQDVTYLLHVLNGYFPGANLKESDVIASYAGVRPLVDDGSKSESSTSREHSIINSGKNLTFLVGGKYTTYRHMAEETVDKVLDKMTYNERVAFSRSQTKTAINPAVTKSKLERAINNIEIMAKEFNVDPKLVKFLVERHGEEGFEILKRYPNYISHGKWALEAAHAIDNTMCFNLDDFYLRRVPLFLSEKDHGYSQLNHIIKAFKEKLSWSDEEVEKQKSHWNKHFKKELSWLNDLATEGRQTFPNTESTFNTGHK